MYLNIPEIMTFNECKAILKIGKNTLLDLIHNGELDAFKVGNRWKITRESVEEFVSHR
jgi:excisionase family DNA binding protein